jgi:tripartite-type tricarboxylate transporter receptor subunit TctC
VLRRLTPQATPLSSIRQLNSICEESMLHKPINPMALHLSVGFTTLLAALTAFCAPAIDAAQFPDRPIRLIVPSAPGGGPDTVARLVAVELIAQMGQQVVVENRPGGAFTIGMDAIAKATADGYTIGYASVGPLAINRSLLPKMPYNPDKDLMAIGQVGMSQCILGVTPSAPFNTVGELIAYAKKNPDKLSNSSAGNGSVDHLAGELFKIMTGTKIIHVPYKASAQAVTELIAGQVNLMFANLPSIWTQVRAGKVRGIAVTGPRRSPGFPNLPTVAESGVPGYEAISWGGIVAPAGVPRPIVARLNAEVNTAIAAPNFKEKYAAIGNEPLGGPPEQFEALIRQETAKWAKVVKQVGAKLD